MFERRMFHALFATDDQKEGMDAFVNKRKAAFTLPAVCRQAGKCGGLVRFVRQEIRLIALSADWL
jgi:hypothetical protein